MELQPGTAERYLRHAFGQMLAVADRLGDDKVNQRPHGPATNAVAALIIHCCGSARFWLDHVGLGRPTQRAREDEFSATATVAELHALVEQTLAQITADLHAIERGERARNRRAECSFATPTSPMGHSSSMSSRRRTSTSAIWNSRRTRSSTR